MEGENSDVCVYRPHMEAESQSFDQSLELKNIGECDSIREVGDSQLVGAPDGGVVAGVVAAEAMVVGEGGRDRFAAETKVVEVMVEESGGGKRKRGRPPRGGATAKLTPAKMKKEEEDVCFICFDGGSLVLCDRRGCPKAYHPACIKRDEAFFRSTARWNCGWHICSSCQKASHYMCYTCTFSLCKGCTKGADYVCVRGNKGFCTTCLRTIMLIENNEHGNKETTQVDFDDKSSWEYLFKVYWIYLKEKLSLTFSELTTAKNPWKGAVSPVCKEQSMDICCVVNDGSGSISDRPSESPEVNSPKRRKTNEHPEYFNKDSQSTDKSGDLNKDSQSTDKSGDLNKDSQSTDKSGDLKKDSQSTDKSGDLNKDSQSTDKSGGEKGTTAIESTEWATKELLEFVSLMKNGDTSVLSQFDVQSLLLDYIKINNLRDPRRKSQIICDLRLKNLFGKPRVGHFEMLKLLEFHFVIKEESQKGPFQGIIVDAVASQVDGDGNDDNVLMMGRDKRRKTRKKAEERGLQINLDEYAAIDVHNINLIYLRRILMESLVEDTQNFHDKVVGSIVRIRISNNDQKQDMYRLVQIVGTSKVAVPHSISKKTADVMLEILNLDKKEAVSIDAISNQEFSEDECRRLRQSIKCGLVKRFTVGDIQKKAIALQAVRLNDWLETEILRLNHLRDRASEKGHKKELRECVEKLQLLKTPEERQRRLREIPEVHADSRMDPNYESEDDAGELDIKKQDESARPKYSGFIRKDRALNTPRKGGDISNDSRGRGSKNLVTREQSKNFSSTFNPVKAEGPIWNERKDARASEHLEKPGNQVDSTGSVIGSWNNQADLRFVSETSTAPTSNEAAPSTDDSETDKLWHYRDPHGKVQGPFCMVQLRKWSTTGYFPPDMRVWRINDKQDDSIPLTDVLNGQFHRASDGRLYNSDVKWSGSRSTAGIDGNIEVLHSSQSGDSFKSISSRSDQPQVHNQLSSSTFSGERLNQVNSDSHVTSSCHTTSGKGQENSSNSQGHLGQSSGQNWRLLPVHFSSNNGESSSSVASVANPTDTIEQNRDIDIPDLPSPTPKTDQDSHIPDLPSPTPVPEHQEEKGQATENRSSVSSDFPVQDSGPSWSSASSLVMGSGTQIPEIADEWGGSSPTPAKTFVSVSSLKPPELAGDQAATPTSNNDQLTHSSPSLPPPSWQPFVSETIEISTLAEESVSDLLAEVDAMESQCGLASPTSKMNCGSTNDYFGSMEGFSPTHDPGKGDAFSSTRDVHFPSQSAMIAELFGASPVDVLDSVRKSSEPSSTSSEVDGETTKSSNVSVPTCQNMVDMDTTSQAGSEARDTGSRRVQEPHLGWGGSAQGITNMGWDPQQKHSGELFTGPRDVPFQAANSGLNRGKYSFSWQGHPRPSKEQRVCKFFESGHCKKGASCDYLHL